MHDVGHVNRLEEVPDATGRAAALQPESSDFTNMLIQGHTFEKHVQDTDSLCPAVLC